MTKMCVLAAIGVASLSYFASPVAAASQSKPAAQKITAARNVHAAWPLETVSGEIMMVDPAARLVVVQDSSGTPFDMRVTTKTRIEQGGQKLTLKDLSDEANKRVFVRFIPEHRGDIARSIQVKG